TMLAFCGIGLVGVLAARVCYLTLEQGDRLYDLSERSYIGDEAVLAPRGLILDRRGRVMAKNEPRFDLYISPFELQEEQIIQTLEAVDRLCDASAIPDIEEIMQLRPRWKRIKMASQLPLEQATALLERRAMLPGLQIEESFARLYPYGRATGHITGYVGYVPPSRAEQYTAQGYSLNDTVGLSGIERNKESVLKGEKGTEMVYRDAWGRVRYKEVLEGAEARTGDDLTLTIDAELQKIALNLLDSQKGVIVAVDPRNGDVLTIMSTPSYDPNYPGRAFLAGNSEINKAISTHYAPGSTFKMVTASAALKADVTSPDRQILCNREFRLTSEQSLYCMGYHGQTSLAAAIEESCNVYFYTIASEMSYEAFYSTAAAYGFGQDTGFPLAGSRDRGILGLRDETRRPYYGNRVMMGIGQGRLISVTPLQMAMAYATFANGGRRYAARLVHHIGDSDRSRPVVLDTVELSDSDRRTLEKGLIDVVNSPRGTARHAEIPEAWKVAGKTGTAQRAGDNDAWFVSYAPYDAPRICVAVLLEKGGHGGEAAAPLAKAFIGEYYKRYGFPE
ncbi:MAG: penicillin-binding transpeptidase domain-containing protein, partial [Candidatus Sumerlaeota bacterium]